MILGSFKLHRSEADTDNRRFTASENPGVRHLASCSEDDSI